MGKNLDLDKSIALIIVDMQKYYCYEKTDFYQFHEELHPECMSYIHNRCNNVVVPHIKKLQDFFRKQSLPIIYLRLCSRKEDRSDLHHFFSKAHIRGKEYGFNCVYPLEKEEASQVIDELKPLESEKEFIKTTFSAFTSTHIAQYLKTQKIHKLIFTGLATSQCVETTARDASDRGFEIVQIEDAQADYDEITHQAALYSSRGVCGGEILSTDEYINQLKELLD